MRGSSASKPAESVPRLRRWSGNVEARGQPAETVRVDVVGLEAACRHVLNRLAGAEPEMREAILEALRVNIHADNARRGHPRLAADGRPGFRAG